MTKLKSILMCSLLSLILFGATSCDDTFVYEKEGDCAPRIQFVFKKHRQALLSAPGKEADAFYSTVGSVHVFIYDAETGELVMEKYEDTDNLQSASDIKIGTGTDRCYMTVDLTPGNYRIVAWCGLKNNDENNAFRLLNQGRGTDYTHCAVKRGADGITPVNEAKYEAVYHGCIESIEVYIDADDPQIIPVELTKDSNDIAVWVQHTSKKFEEGEYEVVYTDANGTIHFDDNSLTDNTRLEYHSYDTSLLTADTEYNGSVISTGAMVAHISTSRLMAANKADARLEVRTKDGNVVYSIPFIKYVLQMQTLTNNDQYYLDCEDTYNCSFYLTGMDEKWNAARIIINNWVVVPTQSDNI